MQQGLHILDLYKTPTIDDCPSSLDLSACSSFLISKSSSLKSLKLSIDLSFPVLTTVIRSEPIRIVRTS